MIDHIQVSVGNLPEWYVEEQHDSELKFAIEVNFCTAYPPVVVKVVYEKIDGAIVTGYEAGKVVFESPHDLAYAFESIRSGHATD